MNDPLAELESLLLEWETDTLDNEGVERLRAILRTNADARNSFLQHQFISACLQLDGDAGLAATFASGPATGDTTTQAPIAVLRKQPISMRVLLASAAALALCILVGRLAYLEWNRPAAPTIPIVVDADDTPQTDQEATSRGVALVTRLLDVDWAADQESYEVGDALSPGRFRITSGVAQVEFFCGATVIIEGPADLDLKSDTLARVRQGRLRAQVPPAARGFALEMDDLKLVDLGTEFGVSVSAQGADIQVFDGEVEIHAENSPSRQLNAGQALTRSATGALRTSQVTPEQFLDIATLETRTKGQGTARYERWLDFSTHLRHDPRLIAYYAFDQRGAWQRKLSSSLAPPREDLDGAIVGARRVPGRWPAKHALEFKHPGDRVRVDIPGEFSSLTFTCWVKIDSLDRWYNSLFLTDNYNQGEPHWQILDTGQLFFSVRVKDANDQGPEHRKVLSPPFWTPSLSGKWLHLATTYDVPAKRVTHYLNGKPLHTDQIPDHQLVQTTRFGRATIGNWSSPKRPDAHFAIRNLNGRMDEFAIFSAALPAAEIQAMYQAGKP